MSNLYGAGPYGAGLYSVTPIDAAASFSIRVALLGGVTRERSAYAALSVPVLMAGRVAFVTNGEGALSVGLAFSASATAGPKWTTSPTDDPSWQEGSAPEPIWTPISAPQVN